IDDDEADIVARAVVALARVAKAYHQFHDAPSTFRYAASGSLLLLLFLLPLLLRRLFLHAADDFRLRGLGPRRGSDDRRDHFLDLLADLHDDRFWVVLDLHAFRQFQFAHVDRLIDLQLVDRHADRLGNVDDQAFDRQAVNLLHQDAAGGNARRGAA